MVRWLVNLVVTSLLFFPEKNFYALPEQYGLTAEDVYLTTQDDVRLHGWYFATNLSGGAGLKSAPTILFFHGNGGNISGRLFKAKGWVERGVSVFLLDYRMYGKSEGKIQKGTDLLEDARSALRWLDEEKQVPAERIILYGESLGSYPAIHLAREKKFAGLILESPFTTLVELATKHYNLGSKLLLKDFLMDNQTAIPEVKAPVFVIHGDQDEICPKEMGERLYESAPSPKEFYVIEGGNHNNLPELAGTRYYDYPFEFLTRENKF